MVLIFSWTLVSICCVFFAFLFVFLFFFFRLFFSRKLKSVLFDTLRDSQLATENTTMHRQVPLSTVHRNPTKCPSVRCQCHLKIEQFLYFHFFQSRLSQTSTISFIYWLCSDLGGHRRAAGVPGGDPVQDLAQEKDYFTDDGQKPGIGVGRCGAFYLESLTWKHLIGTVTCIAGAFFWPLRLMPLCCPACVCFVYAGNHFWMQLQRFAAKKVTAKQRRAGLGASTYVTHPLHLVRFRAAVNIHANVNTCTTVTSQCQLPMPEQNRKGSRNSSGEWSRSRSSTHKSGGERCLNIVMDT